VHTHVGTLCQRDEFRRLRVEALADSSAENSIGAKTGEVIKELI